MAMPVQSFAIFALTCWMCIGMNTISAAKTAEMDFDEPLVSVDVPVESIQQFVQIYGIVKEAYLEETHDEQLFQQAIEGLVGGLDQYSRYLAPEEYQQLVQFTEGDLASVDFHLSYDTQNHQWQITGLDPEADSVKLGLKNGQNVYKIDDQELKQLNQDQVKHVLTGTLGSRLSLQLSPQTDSVHLVRNQKVDTDIQATLLKNHVLVLHVHIFQQDTANEIKRLIEEYRQFGFKAVLIDLRNNPGGLLSAAVESADLFLAQGLIVSTRSRSESNQQFQALPGSEFEQLKLGILINNRSASAAEVFTAALKDHGRAWVIGETSYGKGVVQKLYPLSNGAALQMTVAEYLTPRGRNIEGQGVLPNQIYVLQQYMKEDAYLLHVADLILSRR
jgi:carboxyl-terminal processing protease